MSTRDPVVIFPAWIDTSWHHLAACHDRDTRLWFPRNGADADAKAICAGCPVRDDCLAHAMKLPERFGVWGGLNEAERESLRRRRRRRAS